MDSEDKAKEVQLLSWEGADFAQLAKNNSTDGDTKGIKVAEIKFDSAATNVDAVKKAAFGLEANAVSDLVTVRSNQGQASYYIVKLVNKTESLLSGKIIKR